MPNFIDERNKTLDATIKIFDPFYAFQLTVNPAEFDVVYSYFSNLTQNAEIAGNFTVSLFRVAQATGQNVLTLLQGLQGLDDKLKVNQALCFYLNTFRSKVALYGISQLLAPNQLVARNVVQ